MDKDDSRENAKAYMESGSERESEKGFLPEWTDHYDYMDELKCLDEGRAACLLKNVGALDNQNGADQHSSH